MAIASAALGLLAHCASARPATRTAPPPAEATRVVPRTPCEYAIFDDARAHRDALERTARDVAGIAARLDATPATSLGTSERTHVVELLTDAAIHPSTYVLSDFNLRPFRGINAAATALQATVRESAPQREHDRAALRAAAHALHEAAASLVTVLEERPGLMLRCASHPGWNDPWPRPSVEEDLVARHAVAQRYIALETRLRACAPVATGNGSRPTDAALQRCFEDVEAWSRRCGDDLATPTERDRWHLLQLWHVARTMTAIHLDDGALSAVEAAAIHARAAPVLAQVPPPLSDLPAAAELAGALADLARASEGATRAAAVRALGDAARRFDDVCGEPSGQLRAIECAARPERCRQPVVEPNAR